MRNKADVDAVRRGMLCCMQIPMIGDDVIFTASRTRFALPRDALDWGFELQDNAALAGKQRRLYMHRDMAIPPIRR